MGHPISNISAERGPEPASILLGAHYDTRLIADRDPDPALRDKPGPGADDGASGVAILLELARTLPQDSPSVQLVFFDVEDNGDIPGWDWILGSRAFAENLRVKPEVMILVDMVGDTALTLPMEQNSDAQLTRSIWDKARSLGYGGIFLSQPGLRILDDHVPFIEKGIPSVDIIDINYPYWHTSQDTADHVSPRSLQAVGATLLAWIRGYSP
jgi:Zn-dependent M28 family amino/carboxypeptidase